MRKKQNSNPYIAIALLAIGIALVLYFLSTLNLFTPKATGYFVFDNKNYTFTHVDTTIPEWERGLMNYTITNSTFELLVFPEGSRYSDWMRNTYYPIDIFWINNSKVVYITRDAIPCIDYDPSQQNCILYTPNMSFNYQIETAAGFVNRTNLTVGDNITIHWKYD